MTVTIDNLHWNEHDIIVIVLKLSVWQLQKQPFAIQSQTFNDIIVSDKFSFYALLLYILYQF